MRSYRAERACVLGVLVFWSAACGAQVLEPRKPPPRTMPVVTFPAQPAGPGEGRLVVDSVDGPMHVRAQNLERFEGAAPGPVPAGTLCTTPCVADLPLGRYRLHLSGLVGDPAHDDVVEVEVREGVNVIRRAPGKHATADDLPALPLVLLVSGSVGILAGSAFIGNGDGTAGGILLGGGAALTIGGAVTWPRGEMQQNGASTYWNVAPLPPAQDLDAAACEPPDSAPAPVTPATPAEGGPPAASTPPPPAADTPPPAPSQPERTSP